MIIYTVLRNDYGNPIHEIGEVNISYVPDTD
jgi:hypothetical protein